MTEEYKNNVLRQLTGQVVEGTGEDRPIFTSDTTILDPIEDYIVSQGYDSTHDFMYQFSYTRNNQQLLFYTEYNDGNNISRFIVITDMELNPLGLIKNYLSGTAFRNWLLPLENDTGEGRIYFIDVESSTRRLVYMNDPTAKKVGDSYEVEILASYNLPIATNDIPQNLMKNADGGKFAISRFNSQTNKVAVIEFVNNVGGENEWNTYEYSTAVPGYNGNMTIYPIWSENFDCRVCFVDTTNDLCIQVLNTQDNGGTLSLIFNKTIYLPYEAQDYTNRIEGLVMKDYNHIYCSSEGIPSYNGTSHFFEVDIPGGNMNILYTSALYCAWYIQVVNNQVFFTRHLYNNDESKYYIYFGMVAKETYYEEEVDVMLDNYLPTAIIVNSFNLYSIKIINSNGTSSGSNLYTYYLIFNPNNYNGVSFNGKNSVVSNSVVLNNADGNPIFARNLYNKTILQNTVESTVEIPAYQLNEVIIANQQLISENNNKIINETQDLQKNIYENVLLNFFDTLTIVDNNEDKNKIMINASSYLVEGMENKEDVSAVKVKTTYTDNSTHIGGIGDINITGNVATMTFAIYTGIGVSKVEIISNDESMVYATVDEDFDTNSYYKITQEVEII